jgi:aryl-alcohol dehydrogenase-like predicted oxidoreductase
MEYKHLGRSGIRVSQLCLGTMTFGNEADEAEAIRMMDAAAAAGVNFFDTADIYNGGRTEEIVGRWLKDRRESIVLATKVHYPTGNGVNERGSSRLHILRGVEASLRRLRTDHIDILYLHHWDPQTPIEESLAAINDLVRAGKVTYPGVSNFSAWQTQKAIETARLHGFATPVVTQPQYSLIKRIAEVEILPMAMHEGLGVCPYSPIAAGLLTGKYLRNETGRITVHPMYVERFKSPAYGEIAARFVQHAEERGDDPAALAVAWVASHPAVTSPIIGARNTQQLATALASVNIRLSAKEWGTISSVGERPPLATDREDPKHLHIPNSPASRKDK